MDLKLFASTFAVIFLAELGDKTQLATLSLAAGNSQRWTVLLAAGSALIASTCVAVAAGSLLGHLFQGIWIQRAAGVLFIVIGALYLFGKG